MKLGFIGLGIMGESMCENLIKKSNEEVFVYDLNNEQCLKMQKIGAKITLSNKELAATCDIIFSMVPKSEHVIHVFNEIKNELINNKIWVDMSTINPHVSLSIAKEIALKGGYMLDAPVVKSKQAAINGQLGIYVGGDELIYHKINKYLHMMGNNTIHMGSNGNGLFMKIAHNMLVGQIQNGVNEMFVFAKHAKLDLTQIQQAISYGGGQNFYLDTKEKNILNKDYQTAFSLENMAKDIKIATELKNDLNLELAGFDLIENVYEEALKKGLGHLDFSATFEIKEKK